MIINEVISDIEQGLPIDKFIDVEVGSSEDLHHFDHISDVDINPEKFNFGFRAGVINEGV